MEGTTRKPTPKKLATQKKIAEIFLNIPGLTRRCRTNIENDLEQISNEQYVAAITESQANAYCYLSKKSNNHHYTDWQNFHIILNDGTLDKSNIGEISVYSPATSQEDFCSDEYNFVLEPNHQKSTSIFLLKQTLTNSRSMKINYINFILSSFELFEDWNINVSLSRSQIESYLTSSFGFINSNGFSKHVLTKQDFAKLLTVLKKHYGAKVSAQLTKNAYLLKYGEITIESPENTTEKCFQYMLITPNGNYIFYGEIDFSRLTEDMDYRDIIFTSLKNKNKIIPNNISLPLLEYCLQESV